MTEKKLRAEVLEWFDNAQQVGYLSGVPEDPGDRDILAMNAVGWIKSIVEDCGGKVSP